MSEVSISDVKRNFCGKSFTLRATVEQLARLELETGEPYAVTFQRLGAGVPRLVDVSAAFACFALPHGKHSAASIRAIMPFDDGQSLIEAYQFVRDAVTKAQAPAEPVATDTTEATAQTEADPQ